MTRNKSRTTENCCTKTGTKTISNGVALFVLFNWRINSTISSSRGVLSPADWIRLQVRALTTPLALSQDKAKSLPSFLLANRSIEQTTYHVIL